MELGRDGPFKMTVGVASIGQVLRREVDLVSRFGAGQKLESIHGE